MSAIKESNAGRVIVAVAAVALVYAIAMFGLYSSSVDARTPASWIGRVGSIAVIAGVLLHRSRFAIFGDARRERDFPLLTRLLILAGIGAIVAGFALGTIGW